MTYDAREFARVRNPMLMISAIAWGLILIDSGGMLVSVHGAAMHATHAAHFTHAEAAPLPAPLSAALQMLTTNLAPLAAGWMLMLVAMMTPALIPPVRHIRLRTFTHRRRRTIMLFASAYAAIWIAVGAVLITLALAFNLLAPRSYLPAAGVILVAFAWQCSPAKQRCLNRCHRHTELAAFGAAADIGALRFGATHGIWCAGTCWALMLIPMLLPQGHIIAMAAATILIVSERLEQPRPPCWRVRGAGKALRIVIAQARIRLKSAWIAEGACPRPMG